jgi:hypothetical protein
LLLDCIPFIPNPVGALKYFKFWILSYTSILAS